MVLTQSNKIWHATVVGKGSFMPILGSQFQGFGFDNFKLFPWVLPSSETNIKLFVPLCFLNLLVRIENVLPNESRPTHLDNNHRRNINFGIFLSLQLSTELHSPIYGVLKTD